jgi:o-succinylbenzoate synthase
MAYGLGSFVMVSLDIRPYQLPLREPVRVGGVVSAERKGWLVGVRDEGSGVGWGDIAPLPGLSKESYEEVEAALTLLLRDPVLRERFDASACTYPASVVCGLEMALVQLGAPDTMPAALEDLIPWRDPLPLSGLLRENESIEHGADRARREGYSAVKIKVGRASVEEDIERVKRFAARAGRDVALRLDANRAWDPEQASRFMQGVGDVSLEYIEEPLHQDRDVVAWMKETGAPVALDETLMDLQPSDVSRFAGVKALVLKPTVLGGLSRARAFAEEGLLHGAYPVVSAAYESGVGIAALARFAMALGGSAAAGLDTYRMLEKDVMHTRLPLPASALHLKDTRIDWI